MCEWKQSKLISKERKAWRSPTEGIRGYVLEKGSGPVKTEVNAIVHGEQ